MKTEEIIPSAARLTNSMRDLGYDFVTAVADLIDNSVAAKARRVNITIHFAGTDSWVRIADDGDGMTGVSISEAMRLGTARSYDNADLGKFGLGLKTASLSQCRRLSVASRTDRNRAHVEARCLDLEHVTETDRWEIIHLSRLERPEVLTAPLRSSTGTVVLWENLDRVLNHRDPWGGWAQRLLLNLAERLEFHLGMVFGRFISGEASRKRPLTITVNGNVVEPWDPFVRDEPKVEPLPPREFEVGGGLVRLQPFVLPAQRDFSGDAAWKKASGTRQWNSRQGFYIYRADRMIQSGGWSWMRTADEHTKLARAALEFWPDLDNEFQINISKMRVKLPEELREKLDAPVAQLLKRAQEKYRGGERSSVSRPGRRTAPPANPPQAGKPSGPGSADTGSGRDRSGPVVPHPGTPGGTAGGGTPATSTAGSRRTGTRIVDPEPSGAAAALQRAAGRVGQTAALALIRDELRRSEPEAARDLGW
ncbi:ATP-binding protein [Plantactinospora endophytica]|uniref:ATP-binding protein n=1 Tax=Plantactinospora endophytica TaxID=673535 RepID=A0ABQ4E8R5_9ACTN|nr:ATP-binding protein [Plantactinospora endophytica]GIG91125.1 hypothetical protein Pen02_60610 [Plantactinospora endophytica]